jgi:hypothetical protein
LLFNGSAVRTDPLPRWRAASLEEFRFSGDLGTAQSQGDASAPALL